MEKNALKILAELQMAKIVVQKLEDEYKKVCECNEKLPGVENTSDKYRKLYKTCQYHKVRLTHSA